MRKTYKQQKKDIIENRTQCKIILYKGQTRAGKTSDVVAHTTLDYKYNNKWRMQNAQIVVDDLNARGFTELELKEHVYYSNFRMNLKKGIETHHVRFDELGIPNNDYRTMNLCPGAVVIIDEPDAQANSRSNKIFNDYIHGFLKFHGHLQVTLILITQDPFRLDKIIRGLTHEVVHVYKKIDRYGFFTKKLKKSIWIEWHYSGSEELINMGFKGVPPTGELRKYKYIREEFFTYKGNVHELYDSRSYANLFLYKDMKYEYRPHKNDRPTADEIEEYKDQYAYTLNRRPKDKPKPAAGTPPRNDHEVAFKGKQKALQRAETKPEDEIC